MSIQQPLKDCAVPSPGVRTGWAQRSGQFIAADSLGDFGAWLDLCAMTTAKGNDAAQHYGPHRAVDGKRMGWTGLPTEWRGKARTDLAQNLSTVRPTYDDEAKKATEEALPDAVRQEIVQSFQWSNNAGHINLDRLFSGRMDFMRRCRHVPKDHRVVAIGVQINALADINAATLRIRGVVAAIAAEVLENMGIKCEVWAMTHSERVFNRRGPKAQGTLAVRVKAADEPAIEGQIFNGLSSWFFRELVFAARAAQDPEGARSGMGSSRPIHEGMKDELTAMMGVDDVAFLNVVPWSNDRRDAIRQAVARLVEVLTAQGAF